MIKQLELEISAGIKTQKSSFKSSLFKEIFFFFLSFSFSNEDIRTHKSEGSGTLKRHKHAFNCKHVLKSPRTLKIKACAYLI